MKINKKVAQGESRAAGVERQKGGPVRRIPVGWTNTRKSVKK